MYKVIRPLLHIAKLDVVKFLKLQCEIIFKRITLCRTVQRHEIVA